MLDNLDSIPWRKLTHAYGSAADTPKLLRGLASESASQREDSIEKLCFSIYHQGSVYEASIYSVPFLIELLENPSVQDKSNILELLNLLATGGSWHASHYNLVALMKDRRDTPEYQNQMKLELDWVTRLRAAISDNHLSYVKMLNNTDAKSRLYAIKLLKSLPNRKTAVVNELQDRLNSESDQIVRACYYIALCELTDSSYVDLFKSALLRETSEIPRLTLAMQLAVKLRQTTPLHIQELLVRFLNNPNEELIKEYASMDKDLIADAAVALTVTNSSAIPEALPHLIEGLRRIPHLERSWATLYMALYQDGKFDIPEHLSELQRKAITAAAEIAWRPPRTVFANAVDILEEFGLPNTAAGMDKLLGFPNAEHKGFAVLFPPKPPKQWWKFW